MKRMSIIALFGIFCVSSNIYSAVFSLKYEGGNFAIATINGAEYKVGKRNSVRVDTGMYPVRKLAWTESVVLGNDGKAKDISAYNHDADATVQRSYELTLPQTLYALNLGGEFTILGDGGYRYYFGIDSGWKTVSGTAQFVGGR